jgi:Flp pilus assembly protein TadB
METNARWRKTTMSEMSSRRQQLAWLAAAGTLLSIFSCYGTLGIITGLSVMGITLAVNVHVWAVVIVAFALMAVLGLALGYRRHRSRGALVLGIVAALVVIFSLYGSQVIRTILGMPRDAVEIVGFAGLVAAAIWDWRRNKA